MPRFGACLQLTLLAVLAVVVSGVKFAWEPYNLTATVREDEEGCRAIEVSWISGGCGRVDTSTVSLIRDNVVRDQTVKTESGVATFEACDECSRYAIELQAGIFCLREKLHTSVQTVCRDPTNNVHLSRETAGNRARDGRLDSAKLLQNGTILVSKSEIGASLDGSRRIKQSPAAPKELLLTGAPNLAVIERPRVINFTVQYEEKNETLSAKFTWKMSRPDIPVQGFTIQVRPCPGEDSQNIYVSEAEFRNLGFSTRITVEISAYYDSRFKLTGISGTKWLQTPDHIEPIRSIDAAILSPTEVYLGWRSPANASDYEVKICRSGKCSTFRGNIPELHVINLDSGAIYDVGIIVHHPNFAVEYYTGAMKMLDQDYEAPRNASLEPQEKLWDRVTYAVNATVVPEASAVDIEACSLGVYPEDCRRVRAANISDARLSLDYFGRYEVTVTAVYKLPLNKEVKRSSTLNLNVIGADPEMVTSIITSNITFNSLDLRWEAPRNIPRFPQLNVSYEISTPSENSTTDQTFMHVGDLVPYMMYNFSMHAKVEYFGETYEGEVSQIIVQTEAAKPLRVRDYRVRQHSSPESFTVSWKPPKVLNGRLDYYVVEFRRFGLPDSDTRLERIRVVDTRTNITLPLDRSDTTYAIRVAAVNLNMKREELVGERAEQVVTVPGTGHGSMTWKFASVIAVFLAAGLVWWTLGRRSRRYAPIEENP